VADASDAAPIFIVGMPRTGTTLVERIFARHPDCGSAGELLDFGQVLAGQARKAQAVGPGLGLVEASLLADFATLGREYVRGAREAGEPIHARSVRKWEQHAEGLARLRARLAAHGLI